MKLVGPLLATAATAIEEGRWADAADALIEAWRHARCARIANALAAVDTRLPAPERVPGKTKSAIEDAWHALAKDADEDTLRRLLATPWPAHPQQAQERVQALAAHVSPRVSTELRALHRRAKYTSAAGNRVSRAIYQQLIDKEDHAVVADLDEFRGHLFEYQRLGPAVFARARPKAPELWFDAEEALARIEQLLAGGGTSTRERLLAAVYEAPFDDAPRIVYADVLTEAGDPRGELIMLQLQRSPIPTRREKQLLEQAGRAWFDGIDNDGASEIELARGFPAKAKSLGGELRAPAWATIEKLVLTGTNVVRGTERLRALRELHGLRAEHLGQIALPNNELEYLSVTDYERGLDRATALAPRVLGLSNPNLADRILRAAESVRALPVGRRVEVLRLGLPITELARVIRTATTTGLAIELAGWWNIEKPYHWTARVTPTQLHLHWTGSEAYRQLTYDSIEAVVGALPPQDFETVTVSGLRDKRADIRNFLETTFRKWPKVKDVQFGIGP